MKNIRFRMKLSRLDRVLLCVVPAAILAVLLLLLYTQRTYEDHTIAAVQQNLSDLAVTQQNQLDDYLAEKIRTLEIFAAMPGIYEMNRPQQAAFIEKWLPGSGFHHLFILDDNGQGYYPTENHIVRDQSQEPFFRDVSAREVFITDPFGTDDGPITTICVAIRRPDGQRVGTLCGAVSLRLIQNFVNANRTLFDGSCYILDDKGRYITVADNVEWSYDPLGEHANTDVTLIQQAVKAQEEMRGKILLHGEDTFADIVPLNHADWIVMECVPSANIFRHMAQIKLLFAILAVLILLLFVAILHILYSWRQSDRRIHTDPLCRCGSRAACQQLMDELEHQTDRTISILYTDLNRFKYVNDQYGHEAGDQLLQTFSHILSRAFDDLGFVGRMGGDEFIILCTDAKKEQIEARWDIVRQELAAASKELPFAYEITAARGLAVRLPGSTESVQHLVNRADKNMYENKPARN